MMSTTLVTGANRGIGLEFCRQLKARGDDVIAVCRSSSPDLDQLDIEVIEDVDVADPESVAQLASRLTGRRIDILINNAGVLRRDSLGTLAAESVTDMVDQFRTNSLGPILVTEALMPNLQKGSKVGIVTSRMGSVTDNTSGGYYGYRMSKAAVNIAGVSLARDLADRGIAVALLHPGYVRTDMTGQEGFIDPDEAARGLIQRLDELSMTSSGGFWHSNGEALPW
ncbi:MAG: SDR family oxidoreductase [Gammaproteobacteria bacterium]|jgi:NAD(P)-dependent dehydrogenase (short-subunit alcohol dehydrogenase family)